MPRRALVIANDSYHDAKLRRLRAPVRDAEALAGVLRDPNIGNFQVELAHNEPENVLRRKIAGFFGNRDRDDVLLLHLSCHGLKDESGELYFATTDTEVGQLDATAISSEFVSRQMVRSRSRQIVLLLDCCYSGAVGRGLRFRAGQGVEVQEHLGGRGRAVITASSAMEYAFEGDELSGEGNPSVFTSAVVKGLQTGEADRDQDHRISVSELYDYVCDQVREVTPNQLPNMFSHLEGDLYVARSSYVAPVEPEDLHPGLQEAIASPFANVRAGAVDVLRGLILGPNRGLALSSREALLRLQQDDSRRVSEAATAVLDECAREAALGEPSRITTREHAGSGDATRAVSAAAAMKPVAPPIERTSSAAEPSPAIAVAAEAETVERRPTTSAESSAAVVVAPWQRRIAAFVVDFVLFYLVWYLVAVISVDDSSGDLPTLGIVFVTITPILMPFVLCLPGLRKDASRGRTIGKLLFAVGVVSSSTEGITVRAVLYREFAKLWLLYVGTIPVLPALLDLAPAIRDPRQRALHDRIASTMVTASRP